MNQARCYPSTCNPITIPNLSYLLPKLSADKGYFCFFKFFSHTLISVFCYFKIFSRSGYERAATIEALIGNALVFVVTLLISLCTENLIFYLIYFSVLLNMLMVLLQCAGDRCDKFFQLLHGVYGAIFRGK